MKEFGDLFKAWQKKNDIETQDLSEFFGVSFGVYFWYKLKGGKTQGPDELQKNICKVCDIPEALIVPQIPRSKRGNAGKGRKKKEYECPYEEVEMVAWFRHHRYYKLQRRELLEIIDIPIDEYYKFYYIWLQEQVEKEEARKMKYGETMYLHRLQFEKGLDD